jgi:hypothetical protein
MKILLSIQFFLLVFSSCQQGTKIVPVLNPYHIYEGAYIGVYSPFKNTPSYTDTIYLETLNLDSFVVKNLDSSPIQFKIDPSLVYNLDCSAPHCRKVIELIPPNTLKYSHTYSWGGHMGGGSNSESFVGTKQ